MSDWWSAIVQLLATTHPSHFGAQHSGRIPKLNVHGANTKLPGPLNIHIACAVLSIAAQYTAYTRLIPAQSYQCCLTSPED